MSRPVFLYDGDCAFCSTCARFIERRMRTSAYVVAWQFADLDALGVTQEQAEAAVQWIDAEHVAAGPEAIACLLRDAGSIWRPLGALLATRPVLWPAWPAYRWISRNRHRLPGGTAACSLPQAQRDRLKAAAVVPPAGGGTPA
jgi:predicted DCC family thiol-disulfide oxidoreductase YuxK